MGAVELIGFNMATFWMENIGLRRAFGTDD